VCVCVYLWGFNIWYLFASSIAESKEYAEVLQLGSNLPSVLSFGEFVSGLEALLLLRCSWKRRPVLCRTALHWWKLKLVVAGEHL